MTDCQHKRGPVALGGAIPMRIRKESRGVIRRLPLDTHDLEDGTGYVIVSLDGRKFSAYAREESALTGRTEARIQLELVARGDEASLISAQEGPLYVDQVERDRVRFRGMIVEILCADVMEYLSIPNEMRRLSFFAIVDTGISQLLLLNAMWPPSIQSVCVGSIIEGNASLTVRMVSDAESQANAGQEHMVELWQRLR